MGSLLREHQIQGWERAYFQKKEELEGWKETWRREHEQLEQALQKVRDLEEVNESLQQELVIARKIPPWIKSDISKEKKAQVKPLGPNTTVAD